jgi:hypothetical protein
MATNPEPEVHEPVVTTHALVPAEPPRLGRVASWLQRVRELVVGRPPEPPPDLSLRMEDLERELAALQEDIHKRLTESESRVLHHVQQRFETLEAELGATLRKAVEWQVAAETGSLRRWLVATLLLALLAAGGAAYALLQAVAQG